MSDMKVPGYQNDYTYDNRTGFTVINAGLIKEDVKIEASAEQIIGTGVPGVSGDGENDPDNHGEQGSVYYMNESMLYLL